MNPFKGVRGKQCKRKSKPANVEVKREPSIKGEPHDGDESVMNIPRPKVDGRYRANYEGPVDFGDDFDEVKDRIKCEEEETSKEKDSAPCERSNESAAANDDDNEEHMGDAVDIQPPQPVGSGKNRNGSSKRRNKRTIPRNQEAKNRKKYKCHVCNHLARDKYTLKVHLRTHTGETRFECSICSKSLTTNARLQSHSMTHKDELPNACAKCGRRFATPEDKQTHETCCQRSISACNQCRYKTFYKHHLKRHMQSKHGAKRSIECEICGKQFVEQIKLNQHLSSTHSDQFPFQCSKCFGGYATEETKNAHEDSCGHRQYQCHLCEEYRRNIIVSKIHMRKDHTGDRIECKVCAASFVQESNTNRHMRTVHRLKKN